MIGILYSCALCGLTDVEVNIPNRESDEDIVEWMKGAVGHSLANDHMRRSPGCHPETLKNVKIPMPKGTEWIGGPVVQ